MTWALLAFGCVILIISWWVLPDDMSTWVNAWDHQNISEYEGREGGGRSKGIGLQKYAVTVNVKEKNVVSLGVKTHW